jgi:transposase
VASGILFFLQPLDRLGDTMHTTTVGVDIAKAKFDTARLGADGKYKHKKLANTPAGFAEFAAWLEGFGGERPLVCMEATGAYGVPLAEYLADRGWPVSVVNPARIAAFAKTELSRAKTDKADAKLIARFAREKQPETWVPPPANIRLLQALLRRADDLQEMAQMERNRQGTASAGLEGSIEAVLERLEAELESVRRRIKDHVDNDPDLRGRADLLESIPGVGEATAAHLLVALSPHYGFASAKQAAAHAGLDVRIRQSGQWKGQSKMTKCGDPLLRKALYMPAVAAQRWNPAISAFRDRLRANGKNGKAIACAAMRKLLHIAFAILKSGKPFDPEYRTA